MSPVTASIDDLALPARACTLLRRRGVNTVGALTALHAWDLLDIPWLGATTLDGVIAALAKRGLRLQDPPQGWPPLPQTRRTPQTI